jgi:hypothetical protein
MEWKPRTTIAVTSRPNTSAQPHSGRPPMSDTRPCAETADWMPNQPMRLIPMASPMSAEPPRPKPVQRAIMDVERPSRTPMTPTRIVMSSRMTEPRVKARTAGQKLIPKPTVAPSRNCDRADTWPNRCTATDHHEYRAWSGTLVRA